MNDLRPVSPASRRPFGGKHFRHLAMFFLVCLILAPNAFAYLDPGTGSMILQLAAGAFLGALLTVKFWWMKVKDLFSKVFGGKKEDAGSDK
jgi:hypothetical protein